MPRPTWILNCRWPPNRRRITLQQTSKRPGGDTTRESNSKSSPTFANHSSWRPMGQPNRPSILFILTIISWLIHHCCSCLPANGYNTSTRGFCPHHDKPMSSPSKEKCKKSLQKWQSESYHGGKNRFFHFRHMKTKFFKEPINKLVWAIQRVSKKGT